MNVLLADSSFWDLAARVLAEQRFDTTIVSAFYDDLVPNAEDFWALRNEAIPLPLRGKEPHRHVLLVGTTGAGKTTVVRQLLGTDPRTERFPSTSTAKTTIAPTEIVTTTGDFEAVVTFMPQDQTRQYLEECISAAVLAAYEEGPDEEILSRLLTHIDQRFRLRYILGAGPASAIPSTASDDDRDDKTDDEVESDAEFEAAAEKERARLDLTSTAAFLSTVVDRVRGMARRHGAQLREELGATDSAADDRVLQELFEDQLDHLLREDAEFHEVADGLMDQIELRFDLLDVGRVTKTKQGWPRSWQWSRSDRTEFIGRVSRFSSNYAPLFGTLLTPLVNGIRVAGPFSPAWPGPEAPLVLLDGEGLGHSSDGATSLSTSITSQFDSVDAILLVDNATQPMQAAPVQALRSAASSGHESKLVVCFTHFEEVKGDNLPNVEARKEHVRASLANALSSIGEHIGQSAEMALRRQLKDKAFFLENVHERLNPEKPRATRTIEELGRLLATIDQLGEESEIEAFPVYDAITLALAVRRAATKFHESWEARLGRQPKPGVNKEHWTRVKALTRRLGEGWADQYDTLRPVADLVRELNESLYQFAQNPLRWEPVEPKDEVARQAAIDRFARSLSRKMHELSGDRVYVSKVRDWHQAFNQGGPGSTFVRAHLISQEIFTKAAPIPDGTPGREDKALLYEVRKAAEEAAEESGVKFR